MILVDTSVWVDVFRDASGGKRKVLLETLQGDEVVLSRFASRGRGADICAVLGLWDLGLLNKQDLVVSE